MVCANIITCNAAAQLVFPVAYSAAMNAGMDPLPVVMVMLTLASCAFMTPFAYQTNMMVMGPGGYTTWDFFKFGAPLNLIMVVVTPLTAAFVYGT
jgi:di/tricarboxylate transporter